MGGIICDNLVLHFICDINFVFGIVYSWNCDASNCRAYNSSSLYYCHNRNYFKDCIFTAFFNTCYDIGGTVHV